VAHPDKWQRMLQNILEVPLKQDAVEIDIKRLLATILLLKIANLNKHALTCIQYNLI
jgi:hypothetical protein